MRKNIIVVDDDVDILESIRTLFEHEGYDVYTVKNGMDCIKKLQKGFEGIVLLDIMMQGMDGWDTLRAIVDQGLQENIEVFVITAIGTGDYEKIKGLEPFIHDYIAKPFDPDKLIESINQII